MPLGRFGQRGGHDRGAARGKRPDPQRPADALTRPGQLGDRQLEAFEDRASVGDEGAARGGEHHPSATSFQQGTPASRSSTLSCWETAEAVQASASGPPRWCRVGPVRTADEDGGHQAYGPGQPGSKMHVLSDANGLPLPVGVSAGNTHDSEGLKPMVAGHQTRHDPHRGRYFKPQLLHADKPYDRPDLRKWLRGKRVGVRIARKGIESSERLGRRRWVIGRRMSWLSATADSAPAASATRATTGLSRSRRGAATSASSASPRRTRS